MGYGKWIANNIEELGAMSISESLMTNTTLTLLDLQGDYIKRNELKYK